MTDVTFACVWVQGHVPYGVEYVENLARSIKSHYAGAHEVVCLTDRPKMLPRGVRPIAVRPYPGIFAWWSKVRLFDPALDLSDVVVYSDLDNLIVGDLERVTKFDSEFALIPHAGDFQGKNGLAVVKRYNSSVMKFSRVRTLGLFTDWTPEVAHRLWGDQDWIGERYPDADLMPIEMFPRLSSLREVEPGPEAVVVLAKKPKPHVAARQWPWVDAAWRGR